MCIIFFGIWFHTLGPWNLTDCCLIVVLLRIGILWILLLYVFLFELEVKNIIETLEVIYCISET